MTAVQAERNKTLVIDAFHTLVNWRGHQAAERFWSPPTFCSAPTPPPGRDGLFDRIKAAPDELRNDHQLVLAGGDYVMLTADSPTSRHGRTVWSSTSSASTTGLLQKHWNVIHDEATEGESTSGRTGFGESRPIH